jgi:hypothetical protein
MSQAAHGARARRSASSCREVLRPAPPRQRLLGDRHGCGCAGVEVGSGNRRKARPSALHVGGVIGERRGGGREARRLASSDLRLHPEVAGRRVVEPNAPAQKAQEGDPRP